VGVETPNVSRKENNKPGWEKPGETVGGWHDQRFDFMWSLGGLRSQRSDLVNILNSGEEKKIGGEV